MTRPYKVVGRFYWDATHPTPWVSFRNITAYREWTRGVRKALPGTKCEWNYVDLVHTSDSLLRAAQEAGRSE